VRAFVLLLLLQLLLRACCWSPLVDDTRSISTTTCMCSQVSLPLTPLHHDTFPSRKSFSADSKESRKEVYQQPKHRNVKIHKRSLIFTPSRNAF
jgi:hypothetical protein